MTSLHTPPSTQAVQSRWRTTYLVNLVAQVGIVVTGGAVRLTGSGLGCPTWPECVPGSYTPVLEQAQGFHKYIEFGNRLLTFVVLAASLAVVYAAFKAISGTPRASKMAAAAVVLGVIAQAVLGGITVLVDLHPIVVGMHMMLSMALVAVSARLWLAERPGATAQADVPRPLHRFRCPITALTVALLVLGVFTTGAGPHSGDAETPHRIQADPAALSRFHALTVWTYLIAVGTLAVWAARVGVPARTTWWLRAVIAVALAQGVIGYVQYFTGLPELLVGLHMLGAGAVVVATTGLLYHLSPAAEPEATR